MNLIQIFYTGVGALAGAGLGVLAHRLKTWSFLPSTVQRGAIGGAIFVFVFLLLTGTGQSSSAMDASTANVKSVIEKDFATEVLQAKTPVLVDFYATWCGPCRMLAPEVDKAAQKLSPKIKFVKINVDDAPALAQKYEISEIPALMLFKDGSVAKKMIGFQPESELMTNLTSNN
jgi:thioredoxin 1